jgi:hypothetical protein
MEILARAALTALALGSAGAFQLSTAQQRATESPAPALIPRGANAPLGRSITLGVGIARREPYCGGCLRNMGVAGLVNLSRFVNHTMAIGMESTLWLNNSSPVTGALGSAMGAVTFWAVEDVPLSISGGFGFVVYHQGDPANAIFPGVALVPYIGYLNSLGRLRVGRAEQVVSNLQIGMALGFR